MFDPEVLSNVEIAGGKSCHLEIVKGRNTRTRGCPRDIGPV